MDSVRLSQRHQLLDSCGKDRTWGRGRVGEHVGRGASRHDDAIGGQKENLRGGLALATPVSIGAGFEIKIKDLVRLIAELTGFRGEVRWDPTKPDGEPRRCVDTFRAKQEFGFEAKVDFREGLKRTVDWYMAARRGGYPNLQT